MIFKRIVIILFFIFFGSNLKAISYRQDTLKITGPFDEWLCKYLYFFKEDKSIIDPNIAKKLWLNGKFTKAKDQLEFFGGYRHKNIWLILNIQNLVKFNQNLLWSFNTSDLEFTLFDITDGKIKFIDSASSHTMLSKRNLPLRGVTLKLNFEPKEFKTILVKVSPINIDYINFPTNITTEEDYFFWEKDYASIIFFYFGIFISILITNISLGILTNRRIHLWHAAYIFAILLWSLNEFLFESLVMPEWFFFYYIKLPKVFFILLTLIFGITVFQIFINQRTTNPYFFKLFQMYKRLVIGLLLILLISILFLDSQTIYMSIFRIMGTFLESIGVILLVINIIIGCFRKEKSTLIFAIISMFLVIAIINNQLYELFDILILDIYPNTITVAISIEILLLTLTFSYYTKTEYRKYLDVQNDFVALRNEVTKNIILTLEEERKRTAFDLHDEIGSNLAILNFILQSSSDFYNEQSQITQIIDKISIGLRNIINDLMPPEFENIPLLQNLNNFYEKLNSTNKINFNFIVIGDDFNFDNYQNLMIYRILIELSNNIIKHAKATHACVQVINSLNIITLIVEDNGIGFINKNKDGIGLKSIHARVAFLKGNIYIDTANVGSTIIIKIPIS